MIEIILSVLAAALAIMLISLSGLILFTKNLHEWTKHHMRHLMSFSAGVFLLVAINLTHETINHAPSIFYAVLFIFIGAAIAYFVGWILPESHEHHHHDDNHEHDKIAAKKLLIGDAIHNIADGVLLAPTFIIDIKLGIATTIGIIIHEFIQEISEFVVLKEAGYTTKQAIIWNALTASTVFIGAIGGFFLTGSDTATSVLLGFAAGIFFLTVLVDLFPRSLKGIKKPTTAMQILLWAVLGMLLLFGVSALLNHNTAHNVHKDINHNTAHNVHKDH
jgi:zinc and cadmium transporter